MRAFAIRSFGEAAAVQDLPMPGAGNEILIRVKFAGVNPIDYKLVDRMTAASKFPYVLGADFAGVVEKVPAGESEFRVGDRIFGEARTHGAYAEYTAVAPGAKSEPLAHIPDGVSDEQAAALPIASTTALGSLDLLGVSAGQSVVVMGATGGVGGFAVQIARSRGAHVIATVRGELDEARRLGAEEAYDAEAGDVIAAVREAHPGGVDAVLDLVNGAKSIGRDAEILKPGGSIVSSIFAADAEWFSKRHVKAHNIGGDNNASMSPQGLREVVGLLADGKITARIRSTVGLEGAGEILEKLRSGGLGGKAVIRLS
jgi:NADPH:quinone reductase-like Zn-dependent oxidoreductase